MTKVCVEPLRNVDSWGFFVFLRALPLAIRRQIKDPQMFPQNHLGEFHQNYGKEIGMRGADERRLKGFTHVNKLADNEPDWGKVDKAALPRPAFARHGDPDKRSTWGYPHHWVQRRNGQRTKGIYTDGKMYLHREGLDAAWAVAQLVEIDQEVSQQITTHLRAHRKALGLEKMPARREKSRRGSSMCRELVSGIGG